MEVFRAGEPEKDKYKNNIVKSGALFRAYLKEMCSKLNAGTCQSFRLVPDCCIGPKSVIQVAPAHQ